MSNAQPGFVYLCRNKRNGYVKIGYSTNPGYRESTLQSEEPDIFFEHVWPGSMEDEQMLHRIFAKKRIRGEWFELLPEDVEKIRSVHDPDFSPEEYTDTRPENERLDEARCDVLRELNRVIFRLDREQLTQLLEWINVVVQQPAQDVCLVTMKQALSWYDSDPNNRPPQHVDASEEVPF